MKTEPDFTIDREGAQFLCYGFDSPGEIDPFAAPLLTLLHKAREAKNRAYAPYSKFQVGSALVMDGETFTGTNVENASYGGTICAERSAIATAVSSGRRSLECIAISTSAPAGSSVAERSPCGICRQVMSEFASPELIVLLDGGTGTDGMATGELIRFGLLLPWRFSLGE